MSFPKKGREFTKKTAADYDHELKEIVSIFLYKEFGNSFRISKNIAKKNDANLHTIKNWLKAKNTPSAWHLLNLARSCKSLRKFIEEYLSGRNIWEAFEAADNTIQEDFQSIKSMQESENNGADICTIKISIPFKCARKLHSRRLWIYSEIQKGVRIKVSDVCKTWNVCKRTAISDFNTLKRIKLIAYMGSKRNGSYQIMERKLSMNSKNAIIYARTARDDAGQAVQLQVEEIYNRIEKYSKEQGIKINIINCYIDEGKSGLSMEGREGFQKILKAVKVKKPDFDFIFMKDPSRIIRSSDIDEIAYYESVFNSAGIEVIYCL